MSTRYPVILVHGIALRDWKIVRSFGRIEKVLRGEGFTVYTADTDGFGTIENNAEQLKEQVNKILQENSAEKINIIAHSKGGLDSKYMISELGMESCVASLTTLCTPHRGSAIADKIYGLPKWIDRFLAFWINFWYKLFGDKHPDSLEVCRQLRTVGGDTEEKVFDNIYCQSYSATLHRSRDDFIMGIPLIFSKKYEGGLSDGLVSVESSKFAEYKGNCLDESLSHSEVAGYSIKKKKRRKVYDFYIALCNDLAERGF